MSQSNARTPFDDSGSDPDASLPKSTQPLPPPGSLLGSLQSGAPTGNAATSNSNSTSRSTPPSASGNVAPMPRPVAATTPAASPTTRLKVPIPTVIGLAMTAGVVLAIGIPALMRRAIPNAPIKTFPTPVPTLQAKDSAPEATAEPTESQTVEAPAANDPSDSASSTATDPSESAPDATESSAAPRDSDAVPAAESEPTRRPLSIDDPEPTRAPAADSATPAARNSGANPGSQVLGGGSKAGFSIRAPEGWKRRRSGSQTIWSGPRGAQILVEVSRDIGSSPRADWEKLDRAFVKKYGSRYRSQGIRAATLASRPAAAWEFDLTSKSGVATHKLDIATHANGRGYAVLGSAPTERWDEARTQIEASIDSFRLGEASASGSPTPQIPARDESEPGF